MDAYRHGDSFYICLDLPGINPDSIDLTVEQNVLTIRADRGPVQADGAQMIVAERPYGTFTRQVFLGETGHPARHRAAITQGRQAADRRAGPAGSMAWTAGPPALFPG